MSEPTPDAAQSETTSETSTAASAPDSGSHTGGGREITIDQQVWASRTNRQRRVRGIRAGYISLATHFDRG